MFADYRLKILRFLRKNIKIIFIVLVIVAIVIFVNMFLKSYEAPVELQTTYEPHVAVMDDSKSVPEKLSNEIEDMIEKYVGYCNDGNIESAFEMLSDTCKEACFNNDIEKYHEYLLTKMIGKMQYAIQDFSNDGNTYIYQIKYSYNLLASGLTNTTYQYTEEKMIFKRQKDGSIEMSVGNLVDIGEIKNISENNYLKVDVKSVVKYYSLERYTVKLTNRTDNIIVIQDGQEKNEVILQLKSGDARTAIDAVDIILEPNETKTVVFDFQKYSDNSDDATELTLGAVRVMEKYSGTLDVSDEVIQSEIQNAVAKFSTTIPVNMKK